MRPPGESDGDLSKASALWIDRYTVAWNVDPSSSQRFAIEYAEDASLRVENGDLNRRGHAIRLAPVAGGLTEEQRAKYPHLKAYTAFRVERDDADRVHEALRSQLLATGRDGEDRLVAVAGVQIPGVLDDLYAAAAGTRLGPTWSDGTPRLSVWAPTARSVALHLYETASGPSRRLVPMQRDDATGVWSVTGRPDWKKRYYTYQVTVYAPSVGEIVTNEVTDPYSLSLSANSLRSQFVDLSDPALAPPSWQALPKPQAVRQDQASVYELHVREFSASDTTIPASLRGTYSAFTVEESAGMRALRELAADGLTHVQLMPVVDFQAVPEHRSQQAVPDGELALLPPDSDEQQARVAAVKNTDAYDWGYDPLHYTVPEGSYSTDPDGSRRILEFRSMIAALKRAGLRVVMDVVYNHTHAAGQDGGSILDRIVPGYYQRLLDDGTVPAATSGPATAPEHLMMGKLVTDSVVTWAECYKVDGFRFDLMGFHPKANMVAVRRALDALTPRHHGVEGTSILLYGEGWNFGETADNARFVQASQENLAGTGVGTFNDRLRDAVRGGSLFDPDLRIQGFGSGLHTTPNDSAANGSADDQRARLLHYQDLIKVGLAGNLESYQFTDTSGNEVTGGRLMHGSAPAGYTASPGEAITYVDVHDNETLYDALAHKLPRGTSMADRVRMQSLSLAIVLLGQGTAFVLAGSDRLRSKSLDRNSYNSGDWFNRLLWDCRAGNGFGAGLPPASDNRAYWPYDKPLLADPALRPDCAAINTARERFGEFLRIRRSSPAFALGSAAEIHKRVWFPLSGTSETPGVITMRIDTTGLDPRWKSITAVFNATPRGQRQAVAALAGARVTLHPEQSASSDPVVKQSAFDAPTGTLTVPSRSVAVFVQS
jgi:pullulanase-type alpha-1,6-glucosidase